VVAIAAAGDGNTKSGCEPGRSVDARSGFTSSHKAIVDRWLGGHRLTPARPWSARL